MSSTGVGPTGAPGTPTPVGGTTALDTVVVALDGPSGSGKSSTARGVARALGLRYLDTGAQFRAVTQWMLDHDVAVEDPDAVAARAGEPLVESGEDPEDPTITVDGVDVSQAIRGADVTGAVSAVSAVGAVREQLLELQRRIIGRGGIVVEGRDIGSVVAPGAAVKVYLTADTAARAERRAAENGGGSIDDTAAGLLRRDSVDSGRESAPLVAAEGAVHIDTTSFTLDEVVAQVVDLVRAAVD
ncbi:cytidylate kinase [Marmoricola endophyticus]|uniref:Cytidylate kinase n=1 Tax=Marmoricola endophyticus TaxID=2040280 RepID=A0A917F003_9ACTN|nr:(d)CMP kinase [Marmoricola endophyticus]GGF35169.1 cytidylate kinase [Marmoricola endophyticus]